MKIYICGPTNQELSKTHEMFEHWETRLKEILNAPRYVRDHTEVINPTRINTNVPWGDYVKERIDALKKSDVVLVISGWKTSNIAREEVYTAVANGIPVLGTHQIDAIPSVLDRILNINN